jgi:hypothetical protein
VKMKEGAAPVEDEVAAPVEDAAAVSGDAAEAPLEEEKAAEVAHGVEPETPAALVDEGAPVVEEKEVPAALEEEVTAPLAEQEAAPAPSMEEEAAPTPSVDEAEAATIVEEAPSAPVIEEKDAPASSVEEEAPPAGVIEEAAPPAPIVEEHETPAVEVEAAPAPIAEDAEATPAPVVGEKVAEEEVAPVSESVSETFPAVADAVGSHGAEVKTTTNEEAPGVEEAASLADVPDHVEEDAAPASSLGSDAPVTEQQSLPVESAPLDVADPVEDVPAITEVTPPAVGSVDAPSRVALAEAPKGDEEHIESAEVEHPEAPVVDEEKRKVSDDNSWRSFTKEIQTEAVTASEAAPTA